MPYELPAEERAYLRGLARRQAELAALPIMARRRALWTAMNDAVPGARPPFVIESWTLDRDFLPASLLRCQTAYGRNLERNFLRHLRHHEIFDDDHVCPDTLDMGWHTWCNEFGIELKTTYADDAEGVRTGYHFETPISDLSQGYEMIKPATFGVDRAGTMAEKAFLEETFGDLLPVVIRSGTYGDNNLTQRLMRLMSMETFFLAMYDAFEQLHGLLAMMRDNARRRAEWAEAEGLLVVNNGNQVTCGSCYNFTTLLPQGPALPGQVKLTDMWAGMNSQETVGVSPELFNEFCFPYYRDLAGLYGLVYWGCCEPVDPLWESSLAKLPKLKAVSISRWARQPYMVEALAGTGIVYSRKPNPNLLAVDRELNEDAWRAEIRGTLTLTAPRGLPHEFIVRDVYTVHGNLEKTRRATVLAREEIDRHYPPV